MAGRPGSGSAALLAAAFVLVGCADDGADQAFEVRHITQVTSVPPAAEAASDDDPSGDGGGSAGMTADTAEREGVTASDDGVAVEPSGVVVPVIALDNTFRPEIVEVAVGDEVLWENRGMNEHDVLYVDTGEWGVRTVDFQPGDIYSQVFTEPGEYAYYCSIHGTADVGMIGTVVVRG